MGQKCTYIFSVGIKVENILKGSQDLIPSPSVKIQIIDGKVYLSWKGKTFENKNIIWIFIEDEGGVIESRLPF